MITIIVPVHNTQEYLQECLSSLCRQSYRDIEILIVDDGSEDGSGAICDSYAQKDSRIKVLHQKKGGLSAARNAALDIAQGEYLMFVDSDDYVEQNYVKDMLSEMEQHQDADMVICRFYNEVFQKNGIYQPQPCISQPEKYKLSGSEILTNRFGPLKTYYVVVWNKLFRRKIFESLRFPVGRICEDIWISMDVYQACREVICISKLLYHYRNRKGSISQSNSTSWVGAQLDAMERELDYYFNTDKELDIYYAAREYLTLLFRNRKIIAKMNRNYSSYQKTAVDYLIQSDKTPFWKKLKYRIYMKICK